MVEDAVGVEGAVGDAMRNLRMRISCAAARQANVLVDAAVCGVVIDGKTTRAKRMVRAGVIGVEQERL
ncbi:MAG: hypothetical protein LBT97_03090 [Planctomycetota bacterium]|jgi:hypothetical protein|nr:hypothetical protein [Planctomycetota bacterium]